MLIRYKLQALLESETRSSHAIVTIIRPLSLVVLLTQIRRLFSFSHVQKFHTGGEM